MWKSGVAVLEGLKKKSKCKELAALTRPRIMLKVAKAAASNDTTDHTSFAEASTGPLDWSFEDAE